MSENFLAIYSNSTDHKLKNTPLFWIPTFAIDQTASTINRDALGLG